MPLFLIILAIYTQFTINAEITKKDGTLKPPPNYLLPKKYRLFFHYFILVLDILIFAQFFLAGGNINLQVKTYLDKYIFGRFGGFIEGNRVSFIASCGPATADFNTSSTTPTSSGTWYSTRSSPSSSTCTSDVSSSF